MKFLKFSIAVIISLFFICSCSKVQTDLKDEKDMKIKISSSDMSITDLSSETYSNDQIDDILKFNGTMQELNIEYPMECVRKINDSYRISYLGDSSVAIIFFDNNGNKIIGNKYNIVLSSSEFNDLSKDKSIKDVQEIDPDGEYLFLYTGKNDMPKISEHCTTDGYIISIEYESDNKIASIKKELI